MAGRGSWQMSLLNADLTPALTLPPAVPPPSLETGSPRTGPLLSYSHPGSTGGGALGARPQAHFEVTFLSKCLTGLKPWTLMYKVPSRTYSGQPLGLRHLLLQLLVLETETWDFAGVPVAKTLGSQCRGPGSIPSHRTRSHVLQPKIVYASRKIQCSQINK